MKATWLIAGGATAFLTYLVIRKLREVEIIPPCKAIKGMVIIMLLMYLQMQKGMRLLKMFNKFPVYVGMSG